MINHPKLGKSIPLFPAWSNNASNNMDAQTYRAQCTQRAGRLRVLAAGFSPGKFIVCRLFFAKAKTWVETVCGRVSTKIPLLIEYDEEDVALAQDAKDSLISNGYKTIVLQKHQPKQPDASDTAKKRKARKGKSS